MFWEENNQAIRKVCKNLHTFFFMCSFISSPILDSVTSCLALSRLGGLSLSLQWLLIYLPHSAFSPLLIFSVPSAWWQACSLILFLIIPQLPFHFAQCAQSESTVALLPSASTRSPTMFEQLTHPSILFLKLCFHSLRVPFTLFFSPGSGHILCHDCPS